MLLAVAVGLVVLMATAVVLTREPARQAIVLSAYGIALGVLFVVLQAPDVAMSQIGVGTVIVPLIVVLAISAVDKHRRSHEGRRDSPGGPDSEERG
jgi:energy-converting hydrogenase B subunit D